MDPIDLVLQNKTLALASFLLAFAVPCLIVYALHELRFRRLRLLLDYDASFSRPNDDGAPQKSDKTLWNNPSFEFVLSKYVSDIDQSEFDEFAKDRPVKENPDLDGKQDEIAEKIEILLLSRPKFLKLKTNRRLLITAFSFGVLTFLGFVFTLSCLDRGLGQQCIDGHCLRLFFTGGTGLSMGKAASLEEQMRTVMALAFMGGYISAIRELLRRMSVFDLTGYDFLKLALEIFASVVFAAFLFRAFPHPGDMLASACDSVAGKLAGTTCTGATTNGHQDVTDSLSWGWIAVAPLFGLFPESATRYLFIRAGGFMNWIKSDDNRFNAITSSVPLNVIDGVDFWTRIRLEQCGIYDVQNLATYNPIMLYIETPFGFYQVFDWIAQAQLCHIIGIEKFLLFREINIRTIFDLERAIRSEKSPDQFDDIAASILLATTSSMSAAADISKLAPIVSDGSGMFRAASVADFSLWTRSKLAVNGETNTKAMEHLANWISDDLHVRRLRLLWKDISRSLGPRSEHLDDDKDQQPIDRKAGEQKKDDLPH